MANPAEPAKPAADEEKQKPEFGYRKGIALLGGIFLAPILLWLIDALVPWSWWGIKPVVHLVAPGNAAEFWQFIEGASGLVVVYIAYRGLKALGLTRHDILSRAHRESAQAAVVQAERFNRDIIGKAHTINLGNAPVFVKSADALDFDEDNPEHLKKALEWFKALPPEIRNSSSLLLNDLEAWCMYFTNGVADREIAYGPCATPFIAMVLEYYPFLLIFRKANRISGAYPNTVALFKHWRDKRTDAEMSKILKRLEERKGKGPDLPPTIGSKVPGLD